MNFYPYNRYKLIRSSNENIIIEKPYLKIACILDDFSYQNLKYECDLIQLDIKNWVQVLQDERPNLLLIESAWMGVNGDWYGKISSIDSKEGTTLQNVTELCKRLQIPTVFWNKEDPYHFDEFIEAAKLFDYIFTTDENCIEKYKVFLQHDRVYTLPFAAQIKTHNPINKEQKKIGNVAFAGAWYNIGHFHRKKNMKYILEPALKYDLHIYDRNYNYNNVYLDNYFRFPEIYHTFIKGYVPYEKIADLYKKYNIFLNVNSVDDSSTMFSRRVFELLACGTNVISSYSPGIEKMFPKIVKLSRTKEDTIKYLELLIKDKEFRDRLSLLGEREIFNHHTYTLRLETILDKVGINYKKPNTPGVSIITCTDKEDNMEIIFKNYERQLYKNKELIIIVNNKSINIKPWHNKYRDYKNIKIIQMGEKKSLVQCLNYAIEHSNLEYVTFFDDNYYGQNYLVDAVNAFKYSNADIVGKCSYYAYSENYQLLVIILPNIEDKYVKYVKFSTMVIKKNVFEKLIFSEKSYKYDMEFLKNCVNSGFSIYATNRFNYIFIKHTSSKNQTCKIEDTAPSEKIKIIGYTDDYISTTTV